MLNHNQVIKKIAKSSLQSYNALQEQKKEALCLWKELCLDSAHLDSFWPKKLDALYELFPKKFPYQALSADGSQIYPDRHQGISCSLINIGTVHFSYGLLHTPVLFESIPEISFGQTDDERSIDFINCYRTELEFKAGLRLSRQAREKNPESPALFFVDGSLVFFYLVTKETDFKERFLKAYLGLLEEFYQEKIPLIAYISLPQSKDLLALLRKDSHALHLISDAALVESYLKPYTRTEVFLHSSEITIYYPEHQKPYFFYMHTGVEIARIELPAWIALDPHVLDLVTQIITDQVQKGFGYPLCLAEAHEQAVVKAADRDFFYAILHSYLSKEDKGYMASRKSFSKRFLNL